MTAARRVRVHLGTLVGPTHAGYARAYLQTLVDAGAQVDLVGAAPGQFLGRETSGGAQLAASLPTGVRLLGSAPWHVPAGQEVVHLAAGAPALRTWWRLRRANPTRRVRVVVLDEGLGSYGTWRSMRAAWRREGHREPRVTVRALAVAVGRRALVDERWTLHQQVRGGGWRVRPEVAKALSPNGSADPASADTVVLVTQPFVAMGAVGASAMERSVAALAEAVRGAGLRLVVHPHPADTDPPAGSTGLPVLPRTGPAETDPVVLGARAVVGVSSTALVNLAALAGVPTARVDLAGLARLETTLSRRQRSLLDHHVAGPFEPARVGQWLASLPAGDPPSSSASSPGEVAPRVAPSGVGSASG